MTDIAHKTASRSIAAPFQNQSIDVQTIVESPTRTELPALADFRSFTFPALTPLQLLKREEYFGPTTESNWVIPNVLLVGAYPATQDDDETYEILTSILKLGVKKFVCLQQEYRPGVPEELWRPGLALRPYFNDVVDIVKNKHLFPSLLNHSIVQEAELAFEHCPIVDCGITDDSKVLELSKKLVNEISKGQVIYLHCWGGHGRTGTIVSIMLHLMYGLSAIDAMHRCQVVHDLRKCPVDVGSPQTQAQRDQVTRVINRLIHEYRISPQPRFLHAQRDSSQKKLNRPSKSMNTMYDANNTSQGRVQQINHQPNENHSLNQQHVIPQRALTKFPYFPHSANNLNHIAGTNLVKSNSNKNLHIVQNHTQLQSHRESSSLSISSNVSKLTRNSNTRKSIFLNDQIQEKGRVDLERSEGSSNLQDLLLKQESNSHQLDLHTDAGAVASEDIASQFVHIDISSRSDDIGTKQNVILQSEEVVKLPGATSSLSSPQTSGKSVPSVAPVEPTTIAQALSNARQSVRQTDESVKDQYLRFMDNSSQSKFWYANQGKRFVPSRPPSNATSGARFGVANFLNRKLEVSGNSSSASLTNNNANSKASKPKGKEFLNIF